MKHFPRKRWGQHFLADTNLLHKLVRIIDPKPDDLILEIGPGEGALTELLAPRVKKLIGVEIDRDLFNVLASHKTFHNCTFLNEDFLEIDFSSLPFFTSRTPLYAPIRVIGNIPYHITSPIIFKLLDRIDLWQDIHLMVQKEVADRLSADSGCKNYGRLSVMVQVKMEVRQEALVPPDVFIPKPKVHSAFISLQPHQKYKIDEKTWLIFSDIVRSAFSQRRKMLKNSLSHFTFSDKAKSTIDFARRPETITVSEFLILAQQVE